MPSIVARFELDVRPIDWLGLHRQYLAHGEMEVIVALAQGAKTMIEFGCRDGRTARVLLRNVPTLERYVGVDVPVSYRPALSSQVGETVERPGHLVKDDPLFELIVRDRGTLDLEPRDLPECDAVFIDGDHSEEVVRHDSRLARSVVRSGGVVMWHDYRSGAAVEVKPVVDDLTKEGWPICQVLNTSLAFCRM